MVGLGVRTHRVIVALVLLSCTGNPPGITSGLPAPRVDSSMRLDAQGGVASITNPDSPLYGASVIVPAGALERATTIRLREASLPRESDRMGVGAVLELLPEGTTFLQPVTVILPVPETTPVDALEAGLWDETTQRWTSVPASSGRYLLPDSEHAGEITFQTTHFSRYRAVFRDTRTLALQAASGTPEIRIRARTLTDDSGVTTVDEPTLPRRLEGRITRELVPGNYVIEADFGMGPRCARVDLTSGDAELTLDPAMASCEAPVPTLTASLLSVKIGEDVALTGTATSAGGSLDWFLNLSRGGQLFDGGRSGVLTSGGEESWTFRPTRTGTHVVYFTVYEAGASSTAVFGEARVVIEVTSSNRRPRVSSLDTDRPVLGPGPHDLSMGALARVTATEEPPGDAARTPGATVITVDAEDPDGDMLSIAWDHALPGNFYAYTPPTNALLGRGSDGIVVLAGTDVPYDAPSIVYLAPDCDFIVGNDFMTGMQPNFPLGFWVQIRVLITDAISNPNRPRVTRDWLHVRVVPPSLDPSPDGTSCRNDSGRVYGSCTSSDGLFCESWLEPFEDCAFGGDPSSSPCRSGAAYSCFFEDHVELFYYPPVTDVERFRVACEADLAEWRTL